MKAFLSTYKIPRVAKPLQANRKKPKKQQRRATEPIYFNNTVIHKS